MLTVKICYALLYVGKSKTTNVLVSYLPIPADMPPKYPSLEKTLHKKSFKVLFFILPRAKHSTVQQSLPLLLKLSTGSNRGEWEKVQRGAGGEPDRNTREQGSETDSEREQVQQGSERGRQSEIGFLLLMKIKQVPEETRCARGK